MNLREILMIHLEEQDPVTLSRLRKMQVDAARVCLVDRKDDPCGEAMDRELAIAMLLDYPKIL